jgi:AcrR family transcriptional regulator
MTVGRPRDTAIDDAILLVAWDELNRIGYSALTMTAVAEGAGIQKPALYRRWPTKPMLVIDALATHLPSMDYVDRGSLEADLRFAIEHLATIWSTPAVRLSFSPLIADIDTDAEALNAFAERVMRRRSLALREALARARERGDLREDAPIDAVADLLEGPLMHRAVLGHAPLDAGLVDSVLTSVLTHLRRP